MRKIWITRHGARLDSRHKGWKSYSKFPFDTPLSAEGHRQAFLLAQSFEEKIHRVISSPYRRAIETAVYIAQRFGLTVKVDNGFAEWANPFACKTPPKLTTRQAILDMFPEVEEDEDQEYNIRIESEMAMRDRLSGALKRALGWLPFSANMVIVSHGSPVEAMVAYLLGEKRSIPAESSICQFQERSPDSGFEMLKFGNLDHLS